MANYNWPSSSASVTISAIGTNGATAPTTAMEVGGIDTNGNLQAIAVGTNGVQLVSLSGTTPITGHVIVDSGTISQLVSGTIASCALPAGAATQTTLATVSTTLGSILLDLTNGTQITQVASGTLGLVSSLASGTVTLNGAPAISGTVAVSSGTISSLASGTVTISGTPGVSIVNGTVAIAGTPAVTVSSGTLGLISSLASGTVTISGTPAISGTVSTKPTTPTALTITQAAIAVGTIAVPCTVNGSAPAATRVLLVVTPDPASAAKFYIGSSTVANSGASRGIPLLSGQPFIANYDAGAYFIISDTAAQTFLVMEQE